MKKRTGIIMMAATAVLILTACTQADKYNSGTAAGNSAATGSGTIESANNGGASAGTIDQGNSDQGNSVSGGEVAVNNTESSDMQDGTVEEVAGNEPIFEGGVTVEEEILSDEELDAMEDEEDVVMQDDGWIGSYMNENEEILTISAVDDTTVSFAFTNAGIAGSAQLEGNKAVYHGDDYHVAVFEYSGTDIAVSILSEEDYDASASPLNGIYARQ